MNIIKYFILKKLYFFTVKIMKNYYLSKKIKECYYLYRKN